MGAQALPMTKWSPCEGMVKRSPIGTVGQRLRGSVPEDGVECLPGFLELFCVLGGLEGVPAGGDGLPECPAASSLPGWIVYREAISECLSSVSGQEGPGDG